MGTSGRSRIADALCALIAALDAASETRAVCAAGVAAVRDVFGGDCGVVGVPGVDECVAEEARDLAHAVLAGGGRAPVTRPMGDRWVVVAPLAGAHGFGGALVAVTSGRPSRRRLEAVGSIATLVRRVIARAETERRQRENEARLQAIISNTPNVAIEGYDRDGRVLWWNEAAERIFGWPAAYAIGRTLDELMLDADGAATFLTTLDEVERSGRPAGPDEWSCKRPDGQEVFVISTIFAIPAPGGGKQFVCMDVDVTDARRAREALRQSEEQLRQAQKMEAVGRLAGGVAHDFNNMLVAILGYADLLARTLPEQTVQRRHADEIVAAARRAATLTRQLLAFSRQQVPAPCGVDLGAIVREFEGMVRRLIGEDVELVVRTPKKAAWVLADAGQVEQVLLNLVVNARDAMPEGGELRIEVRDAGEGVVDLAVTDTGIGMADEVKAHIFEPFFTTKEAGKGTGLGLSMVYGIVHQWQGEVTVESSPGHGATFVVTVPSAEAPAPVAPRVVAEARPGGGTLLVVEDEHAVRAYLAEALARLGYRVIVAADPREAVQVAADAAPVDLVVTDVVMPGMSGPALVRDLRRRWPKLRALYISGYAAGVGDARVPDDHAAFLQKPFTVEELREKVRGMLEEAVTA
ncbi:MAG: hybrid sensor histidine kinase/response regulator [Myxococcota bacterium]